MPTFAYQARDKSGQRVSGTREAPSQQAALEALRAAGLYVTQLTPVRRSSSASRSGAVEPANGAAQRSTPAERPLERTNPPLAGVPEVPRSPYETLHPLPPPEAPPPAQVQPFLRANSKEMALFFRQMHAMLNAGTSISHALNAMAENAATASLRRASSEMRQRIVSGSQWSETMRSYPGIFSELAIGMIAAGENGGFLDRMCLRLSQYAERDYEIEQTIKRETWYPKILVFASFLIPSVVPLVLASAGLVQENPLIAWLKSVAPPFLVIGAIWAAWKFFHYVSPVAAHSGTPRYMIDSIKLRIPVAGKTARALATAKFCRALGALQAAGVGLHKMINLAADACGNAVIAESTRRIITRIENGEGLSNSLAATGEFPGIALQMLRTGEEAGSIEPQLEKVADFLEQDAETTIKQAVKLLGVIIFLFIAIKIGVQVVQGYTSYFNNIFEETERLAQ
ncbi:MAG: type II secretion system F family protein [Armatimonadota bacterium]|nr:type II secretion system F family protein [Armatimonadota bacterium]